MLALRLVLAGIGIACGAALPGAPAAAARDSFGDYHPPAQYTERVTGSLYVPMRDGVRLAVRVSRPASGGKALAERFPVIWQNTLSIEEGKDAAAFPPSAGLRNVPALTAYGYVVVQVARRGNGQSLGSRRGYNDRTETDDAYEMTEWLAAQPWSNGRVGIYGCSNTGDAAMHALAGRPPHLEAAFAGCFSWNKYDAMRRGGIFAQWGTGPQRTLEQDLAVEPVDGDANRSLLRQAAEQHQQSTNLYELWKGLPYRDSYSPLVASRFWAEGSASSYAAQIRQGAVPLYILGGWHDELRDQGMIALLNIPGSRILIGPWTHCMNGDFELLQEIHRFFDTYLKGIDTGLSKEPRIHYFTMDGAGGGAWHTAAHWPLADSHRDRLYFAPQNALGAALPAAASQSSFTVNGSVTCPNGGVGPFMQPCHLAGEGVSLATAPQARQLTITGNPVIGLQIRVDQSDANLFAYLEDVAPDGAITVITEGRLKASLRAEADPPFQVPGTPWHRSFQEDARPLVPGEAVALRFDLMPTSYRIPAGHRLQLTLTGADYRERARDSERAATHVSILSDAATPSYLDLPVMPAT
jgi:putative CocE/NonD family hydrolase